MQKMDTREVSNRVNTLLECIGESRMTWGVRKLAGDKMISLIGGKSILAVHQLAVLLRDAFKLESKSVLDYDQHMIGEVTRDCGIKLMPVTTTPVYCLLSKEQQLVHRLRPLEPYEPAWHEWHGVIVYMPNNKGLLII